MTNLPPKLREMWTELYILFDSHFKMPNTEEAWTEYWRKAGDLYQKYHDVSHMSELINVVSSLLESNVAGTDSANYNPF